MDFIRFGFAVLCIAMLASCGKQETSQSAQTANASQEAASSPRRISAAASNADARQQRKEDVADHAKRSEIVRVDMRSVKGRKLSDLYASLTGVQGEVSQDFYSVNYGELLRDLWFRKLDRKKLTEAAIDNADIPIKRFVESPNATTLVQFVTQANAEVKRVQNKLNFAHACRGYKLNKHECEVFRALAKRVSGADIVAYGMTELLPSAEGDLNAKIRDILLKHAGATYLEAIPAVHDQMLSLGLYQFTSYALRHDDNGFVGASKMNKHLPEEDQIPGSVIKLRGGDHHRAAYLFALHNLARLAKGTSVKQFKALTQAMRKGLGDNLVIYMATAHHLPGPALRSACRWLQKGAKGSLQAHLTNGNIPYGKKSTANFGALERMKI